MRPLTLAHALTRTGGQVVAENDNATAYLTHESIKVGAGIRRQALHARLLACPRAARSRRAHFPPARARLCARALPPP